MPGKFPVAVVTLILLLFSPLSCTKEDGGGKTGRTPPRSVKNEKARQLFEQLQNMMDQCPRQIEAIRSRAEEVMNTAPHSEWAKKAESSIKEAVAAFHRHAEKDFNELMKIVDTLKKKGEIAEAIRYLENFSPDYEREEGTKQYSEKVRLEKEQLKKLGGAGAALISATAKAEKAAALKDYKTAAGHMARFLSQYGDTPRAAEAKKLKKQYEKLLAQFVKEQEILKVFDSAQWKTLYNGGGIQTRFAIEQGKEHVKEKGRLFSGDVPADETVMYFLRESYAKDSLVEFHAKFRGGNPWLLLRGGRSNGAWSFGWIVLDASSWKPDPKKAYLVRAWVVGGKAQVRITDGNDVLFEKSKEFERVNPGLFGFRISGPAGFDIRDVRIKRITE